MSEDVETFMSTPEAESERDGELNGAKPDLKARAESETAAEADRLASVLLYADAESETAGESVRGWPDLYALCESAIAGSSWPSPMYTSSCAPLTPAKRLPSVSSNALPDMSRVSGPSRR